MDRKLLNFQDRLDAFRQDLDHQCPHASYVRDKIKSEILGPLSEYKIDPDTCVGYIQYHLRGVKELVADFEDIAKTFGRRAREHNRKVAANQQQQLVYRPSPHPSPRPSPSPVPSSLPSQHETPNPPTSTSSNAYNANSASTSGAKFNAIAAATSVTPFAASPPPPQLLPGGEIPSQNTQQDDDDGVQDDVHNLLELSEVDIPPSKRRQTPTQMSCALTEHQKIGLTWLLEQEKDRQKKGGLLADTMGLGKTVQAIALIMTHRSNDPSHKTTLIVAPLALLRQWEKEILTKIKPQFKLQTLVFHGTGKDISVRDLMRKDIVLCTYAKLQMEYTNKYEHKKTEKLRILAAGVRFYRIILDEAHNIRNRNTKCSKAAAELQSTYKLCMTGTPFMNRAEEIFALIRFLNISPYNAWERFSEDIVKPLRKWDGDEKEKGMIKLQALFRSFTLRRTKDSRLDGNPIIELPPRCDKPSFVEFNKEQMDFYHALEVQQQLKFNKYLINGAVMKNYIHILILLLRLRQACDHPFLLKNLGIPEGAKLNEKQMIKLACSLPNDALERLREQKRFECLICGDETENPIIVHPCGHHICSTCFTGSATVAAAENLTNGQTDDGTSSSKRTVVPCPGHNSSCGSAITPTNILCYNFILDVPSSQSENGDASSDGLHDSSGFGDDIDSRGNLRGLINDDESGDESDESDELVEFEEMGRPPQDRRRREQYAPEPDLGAAALRDGGGAGVVDYPVHGQGGPGADAVGNNTPTESQWLCDDEDSSENGAGGKDEHTADGNGPTADDGESALVQTDGAFDDHISHPRFQTPKRKASARVLGGSSGKKFRTSRGTASTPLSDTPSRTKLGRGPANANPPKNEKAPKKPKMVTMADQRQAAQRSTRAMSRYKERLRREWISSAKTEAIMKILRENDEEKTLIFSLWTSFLDLVEIPIERAGIKSTRYDGSMTPPDREAAVKSFMEDRSIRVILVSTTSGNAGLNLTAASQVIITEPFWNPYIEEQAIDRAHRFGQTSRVTVHRLLIEGTVEDRIVQLQEHKKMLVDAALSEKGAAEISKLNAAELKKLFGL